MADSTPPPFDTDQLLLVANSPLVNKVHANVSQELMVLTEDKVHLCLKNHLDNLQAQTAWHTPSALFLSILVTFATTTFRDVFYLKGDTWQGFFLFCGVASAAWTIATVFTAIRTPSKKAVIQDILNELKKQRVVVDTPPARQSTGTTTHTEVIIPTKAKN